VETAEAIIETMGAMVPPGRAHLGTRDGRRLRALTRSLLAARPEAPAEHARFLAIGQRGLCLPEDSITGWLGGARVLVTGGTGCIGSAVMRQLGEWPLARLASVSRGVTAPSSPQPGVEYLHADVRDRAALDRLLAGLRPDVVFHLAAQRDPAQAEVEVHRTVSTNVLGTRNVLASAAQAGAARVVCASTGKALRPYSPDIYTASKRAAEWLGSAAAAAGLAGAAARFTHVIDNSIIYRRLRAWAAGGVIRLHGPQIGFYVQSARESAELLLVAGAGAGAGGFRVHAITDLGWPVSLLDLALGVLADTGSGAPIYFSGYDPGYEEVPFPGLYDPATAGEVSPLLNAVEAAVAGPSGCRMVDAFPLHISPDPVLDGRMEALDEVCGRTRDPGLVRAALDDLSWALLEATLRAAPGCALDRMAVLAGRHQRTLSPVHRRVLDAIRSASRPGPALPGPALPGPALPGPALPGPALPGPALPGPALPGPALPGPVSPGPVRPGLVGTPQASRT
jgi:nucleoside-diphosphate-sugar epimerase